MRYEELEGHFTMPLYKKVHKRLPRKFKKEYSKILNRYKFLDLNQKIWYLKSILNPNYHRFLIKRVIVTGLGHRGGQSEKR